MILEFLIKTRIQCAIGVEIFNEIYDQLTLISFLENLNKNLLKKYHKKSYILTL